MPLHICPNMKLAVKVFVSLTLVASVAAQNNDKELTRLAGMMQGSFSSQIQAASDSDYFDIRLQMARIWPDRKDGYWLYVEQAVAVMQQKPYRQRVYHVHRNAVGKLVSEVYTLPKPLRFTGAYINSALLKGITIDSIQIRSGCQISLNSTVQGFSGSTIGNGCTSDLKGASYATSDVAILEDRLVSWDRGFDATGNYAWGAKKGGYVFLKDR